jgi:hypothetical protein
MDVPATCWFTTWREDDRMAACVSPQCSWAAAIAEKLILAAQAGGTSAVRLFSLAKVSSNQALLSDLAVWVLAGPAVRQLSGPAVRVPSGPVGRGVAGGLDMVSATTLSLPGMCLMSLVYSAM